MTGVQTCALPIFGTTVNVEASDYQSPGDASGTPCQFGTSNLDGGWIRLEIPQALLPYITHNSATQFMLSSPGATGLATFSDATDPELAPVLNITYGPQSTGLQEISANQNAWVIYPNPTTGMVWFKNKDGFDMTDAVVTDLVGKAVHQTHTSAQSIDLSQLVAGIYMITIYDSNGNKSSFRIIRD